MKRDMDLVREILLAIEASDDDPRAWIELDLPGRSKRELSYHVMLIHGAGLIEADDTCTVGEDGFEWQPKRLTYRGHEYLDTIRDPEIWRKTKEGGKKVGAFSLELMGDLAKGLIRKKIKDYTEVELDL